MNELIHVCLGGIHRIQSVSVRRQEEFDRVWLSGLVHSRREWRSHSRQRHGQSHRDNPEKEWPDAAIGTVQKRCGVENEEIRIPEDPQYHY